MDGDLDLAISSKDWDTPAGEANLYWYENPGSGNPHQKMPWPRREIHDGDVFYTKTQVDIGDLDNDGRNDLVIQSDEHVYLFMNREGSPVSWERVMVPKPMETRFRTRPIRLADINGDGKLDIVGALIHNEGYLPANMAAVFWMEYTGEKPTADNWTTHVIKWGDGYDGKHVFVGENGIKSCFTMSIATRIWILLQTSRSTTGEVLGEKFTGPLFGSKIPSSNRFMNKKIDQMLDLLCCWLHKAV